MEIALVIALLLLAVILFSTEIFSVDVVTVFLLIVLILSGIINTREAFEAFGSDFIVMLASIFVLTSAVETSGVLDALSGSVSGSKTARFFGVMVWMMPFCGLFSAFMNNTTITALLIPPLLSIAAKSGANPSQLLMPMAFANIVGGTCTILGTSTNIAVAGYLANEGYGSIGIFDITPIGASMFLIFYLYMLTVGWWLLPDRKPGSLFDKYKVREYFSEVKILPGSSLIGQNALDSSLANSGFKILSIFRGDRNFLPNKNSSFQDSDLVLLEGNVKDLMALKDKAGISISADILQNHENGGRTDTLHLREVLIPAYSELHGEKVKAINFLMRYGLVVVAINRAGHNFTQKIGSIELRSGDLLLVQGSRENLEDFHDEHNLIFLDSYVVNPNRVRGGKIAILLFLAAILTSTFKLLPLEIAFLSAALGTVLLKIIKPEEVYDKIDWRLLVLIGGMSAFGTAMKNSGADHAISKLFIGLFQGWGPEGLMLGFMIVTVLLTQPMSNAAAALVILPVALQSAESMGVNPMTFGIAVMLSASVSIITPFEPSCILIYGPGKYKFLDFIKVGWGLTVLLLAIIYFLTPLYFPFAK